MMPAYLPDSAPPGERDLYAALATGAGTSGWIVLHSLAIADHVRQVEGEADFVVIVPGRGALVVEVKSHRSVDILDDGRWRLGNDAPTARSPFRQASDAMYSIHGYLKRRGVDLRSIPMTYAVWFTHVRARTMLPPSSEWHPWQVLDSGDLRSGAPAAVTRTLDAGVEHLHGRLPNLGQGSELLDAAAAERIVSVLRPRFELHAVAGDLRHARESQLISFIEEQYHALDAMADNQAVLFTGPAGSGKTMLAMEAARREATQGRRGRLLCFNRLLGRRLSADLQEVTGLTVSTFHQALLQLARLKPPVDATPDFWDHELPDRAIETLLNQGNELASDFLVIDELQDVAREPYIDVLDLMVRGGLDSGRLLLFGDFERQAIFETGDGRGLIRQHCPHLTSNRLTTNCRNLPRIGYVTNAFSKLQPGYRHFRRQDDGVDPTFVTYETGSDQSGKVVEAVRKLRNEGYDLNEIAILSPLRLGSTAENTGDQWLRQVLSNADGGSPRPGQLQHCTIHSFKGLEAPAVVLTDLDRDLVPNFEALLYVGLTRATDRLVAVIETETLRASFGGST